MEVPNSGTLVGLLRRLKPLQLFSLERNLVSQPEISPEFLDALQNLSTLRDTEDLLVETLRSVSDLSVSVLPGCDAAGVTIRVDGHWGTAVASDDYALEIDKIQYDSGEGPCLEASKTSEFFQITDVSQETRWPEFCSRAAQIGFRSSLSFPLNNNGTVGALNIYSKTVHAFDDDAIETGRVFARQASIALHNAHTHMAARKLAEHLNVALQSRDMIGQAKGILMERENVSDETAFEMLKTISQQANVKLREVAQRLIDEKSAGSS